MTEEDLKNMQVLRYPEGVQVFSVEESITRARSRLNEKDYHLVTNNCECFVNWAVTGEAVSYQVVSTTMAMFMGAMGRAKKTHERGGGWGVVISSGLLGAVLGYIRSRGMD